MRESGFDPSNRFGALNVDVIHYAPVCLNTLLYVMEDDAARIMTTLGDAAAARTWRARADARRERINRLLWDEQAGMYYDYNFRTRRLRQYDFATTFYPLWAGIASKAQAARVRGNLSKFEAPGGLLTSTTVTGNQWDAPFGWGPLQLIAVDGLRRYGFHEDADRIAMKFVSLVAKEFDEHGTIVEKYDRAAARIGRRRGHHVRVQRQPDRFRLDQCRRPRAAGRRATTGRAVSAGRAPGHASGPSRATYRRGKRASGSRLAGGSRRASVASTSAGLNPNGPAALLYAMRPSRSTT